MRRCVSYETLNSAECDHKCPTWHLNLCSCPMGPLQIARVLQIQEKEFLEAYRGHMYGVQRELKMWQEKADEQAARYVSA